MESSSQNNDTKNNHSWNYRFQNERESYGGAFTVNVSHPLAGFYHGNEEFQADDSSTPNKRTRTTTHYCDDRKSLLDSDIKPDHISSIMDSHQEQPSVVGVGDHSKTQDHSISQRENDPSNHDSILNNCMVGAPPWTLGLGQETRHLKSDRRNHESEMPPRATSRLVEDRTPFLPTLTHLDPPNPMFVPPAGFCQGTTSEIMGNDVGSDVFNAASTFNYHGTPLDHSSFTGMRNDFASFEINSDERFTEIDFGHEQPCWGNSRPLNYPAAPKPSDDSRQQDPPRHFDGTQQLGSDILGLAIIKEVPYLHHPIVNNAEKQSGPHSFASVDYQEEGMRDPVARPTNMVFGVPHGTPMMLAAQQHLHVNMQQLDRVQRMKNLNFQQLAQFQRSPPNNNATPIMVVDQGTARQNRTNSNLPRLASRLGGGPTVLQPDTSQGGARDQQKKIVASTDDKKFLLQTPRGIPLSLPNDDTRLSPYQTLIRQQFEFFEANSEDIQSGGQGRKKKLSLGQVGICCIHCRHLPWSRRGHAAVYFPSTLEGVYQAAQNMAANHLCGSCYCIPVKLQEKLRRLRKEGTPSSARNGKMYWAEACRAIGLVQTTNNGLRLRRPGTHRKQNK